MTTFGNAVEVDLPWGGDFTYDATGDLVLATGDNAIRERLIRMILTSPNLVVDGVAIGFADDIYHPTWGAGLRAQVGETMNATQQNALAGRIRQQLAADASVATSPPPSVAYSTSGNAMFLKVTYYDTNGQKQVLPTFSLTPAGVVGG